MKALSIVCLLALGLVGATRANAVVPITSCGTTVPAGETGVLQNDLDCEYRCSEDRSIVCGYDGFCGDSGYCGPEGLILERNAVLELNGHDVSGAFHATAVFCEAPAESPGRCVVRGPGRVFGGTEAIVSHGPDIFVSDVDVLADYFSVYGTGRVVLRRSRLLPNYDNNVYGGKGVKLVDVESDADVIESGGDVELRKVELRSETDDVTAVGLLHGRDVLMVGSVTLAGRDVRLRHTISHPYPGFDAQGAVRAGNRVRLVDSRLEYVSSRLLPKLVRSSCLESFVRGGSSSWGVCAND